MGEALICSPGSVDLHSVCLPDIAALPGRHAWLKDSVNTSSAMRTLAG